MNPFSLLKKAAIVLIIFCCVVSGTELSEKQKQKLHPLFRSLLTNSLPSLSKSSKGLHRLTSTTSSDGSVRYGAIVYTRDVETIRSMGIHINSVLPEFLTAQLTPSDITRLADMEGVRYLDPGRVHKPLLDVSVPETGASLVHSGFINNTPYKGNGAIVLIYDTGIDWKHFDFRKAGDTTKSRILYIWDQTLQATAGEHPPTGFTTGVEYTQAQIEGELDGTARGVIREKDTNGHGTHVASTAAGNGQAFNNKYIGMAPEADIIVVKGGDESFTETGEIDCFTYAQNKATALGKPIVVNMSLGGQQGPHDGTNPDEVVVNNFVQNPGRVVCISAGNDGGNAIHVNDNVSNGSPATISVTVPTYTATSSGQDKNYFVLDIWVSSAQSMSVTIQSPSNIVVTTPSDADTTSKLLTDGTIDTWNHIETQNSHRHIQVWIHDATASLPKEGTWIITLSTTGSSVAFDGWLDSDLGGSVASLPTGDRNKTVTIPGTASGAITVASYVTKWSWSSYNGGSWWYGHSDRTRNISSFSSIGPTADGRQKPDIAAPGQGIVAALSSNVDTTGMASSIVTSNKYHLMQGTSMACPHVTGGSAMLLAANPSLTAAQIKNYFTSTAATDIFTSTVWNASWGYGKMDIYKALASAVGASGTNRTTLSYYSGTTTGYTPLSSTANQKVAMRFTPTISGKLASVAVTINGGANGILGTGNLKVTAAQSVAGSVDGIPGTQIGNSVIIPFKALSAGIANVIDFSSAGVFVTSGTDFQIVLETTKANDIIQLLLDDGTLNINRTSSYKIGAGSVLGWYNRADQNYSDGYTPTYYNLLITADIAVPVTEVERISSAVPTSYMLSQNYPNPFNPSTNIEYSIPIKGAVKLQIFDILGRSIATVVDEVQDAGIYHTTWTGKTNNGSAMSSGVYFYRLESGSFSKTARMLLLK
jgi:minor extracellular serine protease Vpr